ncbi:MAG: phage baseplate protein [Romboutsia timonensis]
MKAVYLKDKSGNKCTVVPYYRVGDLFLTTIATNPSNYLGGTWELFGPGKTLVCVDTSDSDFNTVKKTGGSKYLQSHTHLMNSGGSHTHTVKFDQLWSLSGGTTSLATAPGGPYGGNGYVYSSGDHIHTINYTGDGNSGNLQPFITCYVWIRTA